MHLLLRKISFSFRNIILQVFLSYFRFFLFFSWVDMYICCLQKPFLLSFGFSKQQKSGCGQAHVQREFGNLWKFLPVATSYSICVHTNVLVSVENFVDREVFLVDSSQWIVGWTFQKICFI
jgi:hypothetical protein